MTIRVEYAGLNFVDVLARRGVTSFFTRWPFVPGMEVGGTIHALGEGVGTFAAGDRVVAFTVDGTGLADVAVARAALTVPVPAGLDLAHRDDHPTHLGHRFRARACLARQAPAIPCW